MADIISIDYEQMQEIAGRFMQHSELTTQTRQQLMSAMIRLRMTWVGQAAEAFFAEMEDELFPATQRLADALTEAAQRSDQISKLFQDADEEAAKPLNPATGGGSNGAFPSPGAGGPGAGARQGDFGIPRDWLDGVGDNIGLPGLPGSPYPGYNVGLLPGIGKVSPDTLKPVYPDNPQPEPVGSGSSGGGSGSSGGGSGSSGGSGGGKEQGGGSGGASPSQKGGASTATPRQARQAPQPFQAQSPYTSGRFMSRDYSGRGAFIGGAGQGSAPSSPGLKYHSSGGAAGLGAAQGSKGVAAAPAGPAPVETSSAMGLPIGLAALSPFAALLGKAIKDKS